MTLTNIDHKTNSDLCISDHSMRLGSFLLFFYLLKFTLLTNICLVCILKQNINLMDEGRFKKNYGKMYDPTCLALQNIYATHYQVQYALSRW